MLGAPIDHREMFIFAYKASEDHQDLISHAGGNSGIPRNNGIEEVYAGRQLVD